MKNLPTKLEEMDRLGYQLALEKAAKVEAQLSLLKTQLVMLQDERVRAQNQAKVVSDRIKKRYRVTDADKVNLDSGEIIRENKTARP